MGKRVSVLVAAIGVLPVVVLAGVGPATAAAATGTGVGLSIAPLTLVRDPNYPEVNGLSTAAAVNPGGAVVGTFLTPEAQFGFLTDPSNTSVTLLDALAEQTDPPVASAVAVNDADTAAGSSSIAVPFGGGNGPSLAVVWDAAGQPTSLGTIGNRTCVIANPQSFSCDNSQANGINNTGTAVGISDRDDGSGGRIHHAFADSLATLTMADLGTLAGGSNSDASGVDDGGIAVGSSETTDGGQGLTTHAFVDDLATHTMTDLGTLPGGTTSTASAINAHGLVVGTSTVVGGANHPFTYDPISHTMRDLGLPPGATSAEATALNDDGFVVGNSTAGPWVYDPNSMTFTTIAGAETATGINDSEEIVGVGQVQDPQVPPPTVSLLRGPYRTFVQHPTVVPGSGSVVEGNSGTTALHVPVTLSNTYTQTVTVQWNTEYVTGAPAGQADPATDYIPASGTVTFNPGETSKSVTVLVDGDLLVEPDEYVVVSFHDPTNAVMGGFWGLGFGTILNDDHATVVPGGGAVAAPTSGTADLSVSVSLSNPSTLPVTVHWATLHVSGAPASLFGPQAPTTDYTPASGTVTFAPGDTSADVHVAVNADTFTPAEYIVVSFTAPTNAHMGGFWGLGFGFITPKP